MKIIYTRPDGGVSVVIPAKQSDVAKRALEVAAMTEAQFMEWVKAKDVPVGSTNVQIVQDTDVPSDRSARNRWEITV